MKMTLNFMHVHICLFIVVRDFRFGIPMKVWPKTFTHTHALTCTRKRREKDEKIRAAKRNNNETDVAAVPAPEPKKEKPKKPTFRDLLIKHDVSASIGQNHDIKKRLEDEIEDYLSAPDNQNIEEGLSNYPNIKELFLMYNCIKSSEAICERMFSYAGNCYKNCYL